MSRIKLDMNTMDILIELGEGNPGALNVLTVLLKDSAEIDPDAAMGSLHALLDLDTKGIYGPSIWMLFKDVCDQNITTLLAMQRCDQLGIHNWKESDLHDREKSLALREFAEGAVALVQKQLPNFAPSVEPETASA